MIMYKSYKHGGVVGYKRSPTYISWSAMKQRCLDLNHPSSINHGKRGVKICDRWINSFGNFLEDMGEKPKGMTLDRINVDGDYTPDNCRWTTHTVQSRNRRISKTNKSGISGVHWSNTYRKWKAQIKVDGKLNHLGYYRDFLEAVSARLSGEAIYWNEEI